MSDADLVRQTLSGRTEAYGELVRRWAGRITALCHSKVGRADIAEDLSQESLLRGYRALKTLADPEKFGALEYIITNEVMTLQTPQSVCMPPPIFILLFHSIANM